MENRAYTIKVYKSKRAELAKHEVTKPYDAKDVPGMPKGQFFIVGYKPMKYMLNGVLVSPSIGKIQETVFNGSDQSELFEDIAEALTNPENYTVSDVDGSISIHATKRGVVGMFIERKTPNNFIMIGSDGNPLKDKDGKPRETSTLRFFVHEGQDADVRFARECQRITNRNGWVKSNDEPEE